MPIAVLATGHLVVQPARGAVLLTLSRMDAVEVDPAAQMARVEGGARWGRVLQEAGEFGLAGISGSTSTVGVVGYHLGGGQSPILGRRYGYAADHVRSFRLVTADGSLREVSETSEPDLFWALRGGMGNFGVVTSMEFSLFPVETFYGGGIFFAGAHAEKVLHAWREWVTLLPAAMTSSVAFLRHPPLPSLPEPLRGNFVVHVRFSSVGSAADAEAALAPLRALAPTVLDTIDENPYSEAARVHLDPPAPLPWVERSTALHAFPAEAADALLAALGPDSGTALGFAEVRALGGALAAEPAVPNAVSGRSAQWSVAGSGAGSPDRVPEFHAQLASLVESLAPWSQDELNTNPLTAAQGITPAEVRAVYGSDRYDRLAEIKRKYDPQNLFRMNHNIPPASVTR
ncbi:FAD-binding oxidoreductase [Streptomyces sp. NPDC102274]|uniref:FAD-binding oxidoreductase n=1 Tax=Streptomyces sp. NPDC102274 TaxID=3366151 RepID=UPI0038252873